MQLQQAISREHNQRMLGKTLRVLIEEQDEKNPSLWIGRSSLDAPEVDGQVWVKSHAPLTPGSFHPVTITATEAYDLVGEI